MKDKKTIDIIASTRFKKLSLNENKLSTIYRFLKKKLQLKNAASVYQFGNLFNLPRLQNLTLSYIERCFTIVSNNKSLLELEFSCISKILASSELLITSEI